MSSGLSRLAGAVRNFNLSRTRSWLKTKIGLASLATLIAAPAAALTWQANSDTTGSEPQVSSQATASVNDNNAAAAGVSHHASAPAPSGSNTTSTVVTFNGQVIPLSPDGSVHKVIQTAGGTTTIDVSNQSTISGNLKTHSTNSISVNTTSISTANGQTAQSN